MDSIWDKADVYFTDRFVKLKYLLYFKFVTATDENISINCNIVCHFFILNLGVLAHLACREELNTLECCVPVTKPHESCDHPQNES